MKHVAKLMTFVVFFSFFYQYDLTAKPRVSIITSVFDPQDKFLAGFLKDITRQTIFYQCELLLICPPVKSNSAKIIQEYCLKYSNIKHIKLESDPGLYGVWNIGVKLAEADFVTNANIDDRRNPCCLETQVRALEEDASITLVYAPFYATHVPNTVFENPYGQFLLDVPEFSVSMMKGCSMGPMPMWRTSIHDVCGYFRDDFFSAGDYEMWCRMVSCGAVFKKLPFVSGVYYFNPKGLSTDQDNAKVQRRTREDEMIIELYSYLWS